MRGILHIHLISLFQIINEFLTKLIVSANCFLFTLLGEKKLKLDNHGQPLINYGIEEIRFEQEPFPLYHGEVIYHSFLYNTFINI
jgi:hypothetical protein